MLETAPEKVCFRAWDTRTGPENQHHQFVVLGLSKFRNMRHPRSAWNSRQPLFEAAYHFHLPLVNIND